jgi:hypothetical protein
MSFPRPVFVILRWLDVDKYDFTVVHELWLSEYTQHSWRYLWLLSVIYCPAPFRP